MNTKTLFILLIISIIMFFIYFKKIVFENKKEYKQVYIDSGIDAPLRHKYIPSKNINKNKKVKKSLNNKEEIYIISDEDKEKNVVNLKQKVNKLNGYAKYCWSNGDCYTGYWKEGYMEGGGYYEFSDGVMLIDDFKKGFPIHDEWEYKDKRYRIVK